MSLSRPVKFPLLKLPFLCIKCVIHSLDLFDIICFATISNRARRIVKASNYPLKVIDISPSISRKIYMKDVKEIDRGEWRFMHQEHGSGVPLVLQRNSQPILTSERFISTRVYHLHSNTAGEELDALKMGIEFMIDVFGCNIRNVYVAGISELLRLGISSVKELHLKDLKPVNIADLKYVLETIRVTDVYVFFVPIPKEFYCDPQIFKCRQMTFSHINSADWVTLEILCQFEVPQLRFSFHRFSVEDVVSYINYWFTSDNRKLEYLLIHFDSPSLENYKIDHLNPMPFSEKRRSRWTLNKSWEGEDLSSGKDILRQDGLLATLHAYRSSIFFYVWHKRFSDDVQQ